MVVNESMMGIRSWTYRGVCRSEYLDMLSIWDREPWSQFIVRRQYRES